MPTNTILTIITAAIVLGFILVARIGIVGITDMVKKLRRKPAHGFAKRYGRNIVINLILLLLTFAATVAVVALTLWGMWGLMT